MQGCWTLQVRGGIRDRPTLGHALTQTHLGTNLMDTPRPGMVRHRLLTSDAPRSIFRSEDGTHAVSHVLPNIQIGIDHLLYTRHWEIHDQVSAPLKLTC